jgi:Trk-type K+ transport system membrane component
MGVGVSIFTITLGAILKFAISPTAMTSPVDVHVIGVILMIVGGLSFLLQLLVMTRASRRPPGSEREHLYKGDNPPPAL